MKSDPASTGAQSASGEYIAQARDGGTASVAVNHYAIHLQSMLPSLLAEANNRDSSIPAFQLALATLNLEAPLMPEVVLHRTLLEDRLHAALSTGRSLNLRGDEGSGRTELARAVTEAMGAVFWLDLDANQHLQPEAAMDLFVASVRASWATTAVPSSRAVIFDNVDGAVLQISSKTWLKPIVRMMVHTNRHVHIGIDYGESVQKCSGNCKRSNLFLPLGQERSVNCNYLNGSAC